MCEYAKVLNPDIKVIGTAGSADKIDILKKIGVDVPINYKTQNILEVLREHAPIDVYVALPRVLCLVLTPCVATGTTSQARRSTLRWRP